MNGFSFGNQNNSGNNENQFSRGMITIRNRILAISGTIHQISNITSFRVLDLSSKKNIPQYLWVLLGVTLLVLLNAFASKSLVSFGSALLLVGATCYVFARHFRTRSVSRFLLNVVMNSGQGVGILSDDRVFLNSILLNLAEVIENRSQQEHNVSINIDSRQIINGNVHDSNVSAGDMAVNSSIEDRVAKI